MNLIESATPAAPRKSRTFATALVVAAAAAFGLLGAGPGHAGVELVSGSANHTCKDFEGPGQDWSELKVDPPKAGTYTSGSLSVTVSNLQNDKTFDWSANRGIDAVFVKAGAAGSNLYRYDPPAEETSDTGLTSPGSGTSNEISHISFCHDPDPKIEVVKDGPGMLHAGDTGTFTFKVTNTGEVDLTDVVVTDSEFGPIGTIATLAKGASQTISKDFVVPGVEKGPNCDPGHYNVATVTAKAGATSVSDTDDHCVTLIDPKIEVVKDGPGIARAGDTATFSFKVTNTGDVDLTDVVVTDSEFGAIGTIATLAKGATETISKDFVVPGANPGPNCDGHHNVATASGDDPLDKTVSDTDDHCVTLIDPKIEVVKDGPGLLHAGDTATFTFKVTNTGDVDLTNVVVTDSEFGAIGTIATLAKGATETISKDFVVPGPASGPDCDPGHYNVATASGKDPLDKSVSDTDDHCVTLIDPKIEVVKDGPAVVHAGDTATFTFKVTNIGDVDLSNVVVTDDRFGAIGTIAALPKGASETISKDFMVPGAVPGPDCSTGHYNVATATGKDQLDKSVSDTDDHCTELIDPAIQIVKTGPAAVHVGDIATYTFAVTNTGDVDLTDVQVTDDKFGFIGTIGDLAVGETKTITKDFQITAASPAVDCEDGHHNVATASGKDPLGLEVSDTDDHCTDLPDPAIDIVKDGAALAHEGDIVTYTFLVTNTGDVPLTNVEVTDDVLGPIGTIGDLAPGASDALSMDFTVPADTDLVANIATACGVDPLDLEVCDDDPHNLIVIHPDIEIVKTADPENGGPRDVTYTYVVTNLGDTTLNDVAVNDDVLGLIGTIDTLAPGASETLTTTVAVDGDSPRTNVGEACGSDVLGLEVCDTDDATIAIVLAVIEERPISLPATGSNLRLWLFASGLFLALGASGMNLQLTAHLRRLNRGA